MMTRIAEALATQYSQYALEIFADVLGFKELAMTTKLEGNKWAILKMLIEWRMKLDETNKDQPRKRLARQFMRMSDEWKVRGRLDQPRPKFKRLARELDVTS